MWREPTTYKLVLDTNGALTDLEIWQGSGFITVSLAAERTHKDGYRWSEIRQTIDRLQAEAKQRAADYAGLSADFDGIKSAPTPKGDK